MSRPEGADADKSHRAPAEAGTASGTAAEGPYAECVLCRNPTAYPEATRGITFCPVCAWPEGR